MKGNSNVFKSVHHSVTSLSKGSGLDCAQDGKLTFFLLSHDIFSFNCLTRQAIEYLICEIGTTSSGKRTCDTSLDKVDDEHRLT